MDSTGAARGAVDERHIGQRRLDGRERPPVPGSVRFHGCLDVRDVGADAERWRGLAGMVVEPTPVGAVFTACADISTDD
jgi:hypothetical protein